EQLRFVLSDHPLWSRAMRRLMNEYLEDGSFIGSGGTAFLAPLSHNCLCIGDKLLQQAQRAAENLAGCSLANPAQSEALMAIAKDRGTFMFSRLSGLVDGQLFGDLGRRTRGFFSRIKGRVEVRPESLIVELYEHMGSRFFSELGAGMRYQTHLQI